MKIKSPIAALVILILFGSGIAGCQKNSGMDCNFLITPYLQEVSGGYRIHPDNVVAHAFYADTAIWEVASYVNAEAGVLTQKENVSEKMYPLYSVSQDKAGILYMGPFTQKKLILIVCDKGSRIYGWRAILAVDDLENVYLTVTFKPWQTNGKYTEGRWTMVNETPPVKPTVP